MPPKAASKRGANNGKKAVRKRRTRATGRSRDPITALSVVGRSAIADLTNAGKQGSIAGFAFTAVSHAIPAVKGAYSTNAAPSFFVHLLAWLKSYISSTKLGPFLDGALDVLVEHVDQLWGAIIIGFVVLLSRFPRRDGVALVAFVVTLVVPAQSNYCYLAVAAALYLYSLPIWAPYRWAGTVALIVYACVFAPDATKAWTYKAPSSFWGT